MDTRSQIIVTIWTPNKGDFRPWFEQADGVVSGLFRLGFSDLLGYYKNPSDDHTNSILPGDQRLATISKKELVRAVAESTGCTGREAA